MSKLIAHADIIESAGVKTQLINYGFLFQDGLFTPQSGTYIKSTPLDASGRLRRYEQWQGHEK
jgi:hypothetical protein